MPSLYTYLISSLPLLNFLGKPTLDFDKFVSLCARFIPLSDLEIIKNVSVSTEFKSQRLPVTLKKWQDFDTALRNELVKIRSSRKHVDPSKYLKPLFFPDLSLSHAVASIVRNPSLLEVEKALDLLRWRFLDEISFGHYFDLELLIIYALKLQILIRWENIGQLDKEKIMETTLAAY